MEIREKLLLRSVKKDPTYADLTLDAAMTERPTSMCCKGMSMIYFYVLQVKVI